MTRATLRPGPIRGRVPAPPSKSYTHRFVLAAHLGGRSSRIRRPLVSDDTRRTVEAVRLLGSAVEMGSERWTVAPSGSPVRSDRPIVRCGESGTTLRFVTAAAALQPGPFRFVGSGRLPRRPMGPLLDALTRLGARVRRGAGTTLPFLLEGPIHGGETDLEVDESSQFTSALLLALPTVQPDSYLRTVGTPVSEPYVQATREVLRRCGVRLRATAYGYYIPGGQSFRPLEEEVPGDASSAAYLWAAAAVTTGSTTVDGVPATWPQADLAVLPLLRQYGATVRRSNGSVTVRGESRRPFRCDLTACPDLYPLAGVLAALARGRSYLLGGSHVVAKESNRKLGTMRLVRALGARATERRGAVVIDGTDHPRRLRLEGMRDHRLVMSAAVGALAASGPSVISDAASVGKSFPEFWTMLAAITGEERMR